MDRTAASSALIAVGHLARIALAAVFLLSVTTKGADPASFAEQIGDYRVTPASWGTWQAWLFLVVEAVLGIALLVNFRPRVVLPAAFGLLGFFAIVVAIAIGRGYTGSCGCFGGAVYRTPRDTIVEDLAFMGLAILAFFGMRARDGWRRRGRRAWQRAAVGAGLVAGLAVPLVGPRVAPPGFATAGVVGKPFDHVVVQDYEGSIEHGRVVVVLLSPTERDPVILTAADTLSRDESLPPVIGVVEGSNEDMVRFLFEAAPSFDGLGHAPRTQLRRFYRTLPVVFLLSDGVIAGAWHGTVPPPAEVRGVIG
jgi:hypothetical protein